MYAHTIPRSAVFICNIFVGLDRGDDIGSFMAVRVYVGKTAQVGYHGTGS